MQEKKEIDASSLYQLLADGQRLIKIADVLFPSIRYLWYCNVKLKELSVSQGLNKLNLLGQNFDSIWINGGQSDVFWFCNLEQK